jgi:hypothetical protein
LDQAAGLASVTRADVVMLAVTIIAIVWVVVRLPRHAGKGEAEDRDRM